MSDQIPLYASILIGPLVQYSRDSRKRVLYSRANGLLEKPLNRRST